MPGRQPVGVALRDAPGLGHEREAHGGQVGDRGGGGTRSPLGATSVRTSPAELREQLVDGARGPGPLRAHHRAEAARKVPLILGPADGLARGEPQRRGPP